MENHLIARTNPIADKDNIILWNTYRVTVLADKLFRIEKSKNKQFRDRATQSVWFRNMPKQAYKTEQKEDRFFITTNACSLILSKKRNACKILLSGNELAIDNTENLLGTYRTLDACDGATYMGKAIELGTGVCSKSGVAVFDDANSLSISDSGEILSERGDGSDEYVFVYGKDYREALKALYMITGKTPMLPRYALGNWWSRYHHYTDKEYLRVLNAFEERDIPFTVATIDMDWHYSNAKEMDSLFKISENGKIDRNCWGGIGWTGYTWNKNLFPDYRTFLKTIEKKKLKITLNLHPADGVRYWEDCYEDMARAMDVDPQTAEQIPFDIANPKFIENYFKIIHKPYEEDGVQFWWIDWQQGEHSKMKGLDPLWALNHYHYLDNGLNHQTALILSRYAGIGSHRYPVGFSGDTCITWKTLQYLPYFTFTASNIGYSWWSHDIGGHYSGEKNDELFVRHLQFGVFSPINRLHCTNMSTMTKEPWFYGNGSGLIMAEYLRLRHRLIPFLYTASYQTSKQGRALIEPLYYEWKTEQAYMQNSEYLFGDTFLVAPIITPAKSDGYASVKVWFPNGIWTDIFTGDEYEIGKSGKTVTVYRELQDMPVFCKAGTIYPLSMDKNNSCKNPEKLEIRSFIGNGAYTLYEDGKEDWMEGEFFTKFTSTFTKTKGVGMQTLAVSSNGDGTVIPKNRQLFVRFEGIENGKITLYIDEKKAKVDEVLTDCIALNIPFKAGKTYKILVEFTLKSKLEKLIERARTLLIRSNDDNLKKEWVYNQLSTAKTVKEYVKIVNESNLKKIAKRRLKETL